jgi:hypothetical protein
MIQRCAALLVLVLLRNVEFGPLLTPGYDRQSVLRPMNVYDPLLDGYSTFPLLATM